MKKNDCFLEPIELENVRAYAQVLLNKADAMRQFPTPVERILETADLFVNQEISLEHAPGLLEKFGSELRKKARLPVSNIKKLFGLLHVPSGEIILNHSLHKNKKTFVKLHEAGHSFIPHHKKFFEVMEDGEVELDPYIDDLLEREANNFASEVLFQLDEYAKIAADYEISIKTPMDLSKKFGSSVYASMRRYVQTHFSHIALAVYEIDPLVQNGFILRREPFHSESFLKQFGVLNLPVSCSSDEPLGRLLGFTKLDITRRMFIKDRRDESYECALHIFNNSYQIFVLLIPSKKSRIFIQEIL